MAHNAVMRLGSDVLFERQLLTGRTVGLVCNPASVDARYTHVLTRAAAARAELPVTR